MIPYTTFTLSNGLRVVHNHDTSTAMVAVNIIYNVGSRDESPQMTGIAHLFEHLMFAGSVNIPDFDGEMERAGGINNAWTSNDFTNFYDVAPAANLETLLWLESDRMLGLAFSEKSLEVQRNVVIEEFKQTSLNRPYGDLDHRLRSLLYTSHPYRFPTIGKEISHIEKVTLDDIKHFFYSHYAPNNAVLAVSGNVTLEETRAAVEKWFGDIPRCDVAPRLYLPEPAISSPRREDVVANVPQAMVVIAFPMPGYGKDGYIECDLITDLLASGHSSRFYRNLIMSAATAQEATPSETSVNAAAVAAADMSIFADADASIIGSEEPGFLMLKARLTDPSDDAIARAEHMLLTQALHLTTLAPSAILTQTSEPSLPVSSEGVTDHELRRAINRFASNATFSAVSYLSRAQSLAMAEMHGEDINAIIDRYRAVTPRRIAEVARRIFDPSHRVTLVYHPANPR